MSFLTLGTELGPACRTRVGGDLLDTLLLWAEGRFQVRTVVPIRDVDLDWQFTLLCSGEPWPRSCWSFFPVRRKERDMWGGVGGTETHSKTHTNTDRKAIET